MEFRSPAEASIRLATALIRILGTFFPGGVAGAVDIESAHFVGSAFSWQYASNKLILLLAPWSCQNPTLCLVRFPTVITLVTNSPRLHAAP